MPAQASAAHRKIRWSTPPPKASAETDPQPYRRRRPETTTLHRIVREHLETYLALANQPDPTGNGVPDQVEKEFRSYLKCGILAHGFARARCASRGYDFLVALSPARAAGHVLPARPSAWPKPRPTWSTTSFPTYPSACLSPPCPDA